MADGTCAPLVNRTSFRLPILWMRARAIPYREQSFSTARLMSSFGRTLASSNGGSYGLGLTLGNPYGLEEREVRFRSGTA